MPAWLVTLSVVLVAAAVALWAARRVLRRSAQRTVLEFRARLDRYKLVASGRVKAELLADPIVGRAVDEAAREHRLPRARVERQVEEYIDEIVPFFNVLSYYKLGFNLSKLLTRLFYRISVEYQDSAALGRIPKRDVVLYQMNHRSNMDYVVVTYVLAQVVSISYAVGEWARTWPLEYVFKSFGSYFIRRKFREPLYHLVLERYVQLITRHRVTQGIFPEGGLSRDGRLGTAKIGLLDYIVRTLEDPAFEGDLWLVPVAINYDRVLEDGTLTRELIVGAPRPTRLGQLWGWISFAGWNALQLLAGQRHRYGRVAVNFATPISVRGWLGEQAPGLLALPRAERLPHIQRLADEVLARIGAVIPVTPVPFAAAGLLSFPATVIPRDRLLERLEELRDQLRGFNARLVRGELPVEEVWDRALRTFRARRWVVEEGATVIILPNARPLLQYYANSIAHLLPEAVRWDLTPAAGVDPTMPRLAGRSENRQTKSP
ncbi:MAG: 1-acyl-sn-glycerol-3-phosphate acyltransferase [Gemmatimonadales bacterium]